MNFLKRKKKICNEKDWGEIAASIVGIFLYTGIGAIIYIVIRLVFAIIKWIF